MLKHNFVFAVSLVAMFIVGISSARADVVSTTYVDGGLAAKFNKKSITKNAIVTTDDSGNVAPVTIDDSETGTYVTGVTVSEGKVTLSRGTPSIPTGALASKDKITNDDVAADAAIAQSKISGLTDALNAKEASANKVSAALPADASDAAKKAAYPSYYMVEDMIDTKFGVIPAGEDKTGTATIWVE